MGVARFGVGGLVYCLILAVAMYSQASLGEPSMNVVVWEGSTSVKRHVALLQDQMNQDLGVQLVVVGNSSGSGYKKVLSGELPYAVSSSPLAELMKKYGQHPSLDSTMDEHYIGTDQIFVVVHPDNPVQGLSNEQIKGIYTGRIVNWREVGGHDAAIELFTPHMNSGTRLSFQNWILHGERYATHVQDTKATRYVLNQVASDLYGMGVVSSDFLRRKNVGVRAVNREKIGRPLVLISNGPLDAKTKRIVNYLANH